MNFLLWIRTARDKTIHDELLTRMSVLISQTGKLIVKREPIQINWLAKAGLHLKSPSNTGRKQDDCSHNAKVINNFEMEISISNCTLSYLLQSSQLLNNSDCFCKYTAGIQNQSSWSTALLENHLVFKLFTGLLENDQNEALNSLNIFFFPSKAIFKYSPFFQAFLHLSAIHNFEELLKNLWCIRDQCRGTGQHQRKQIFYFGWQVLNNSTSILVLLSRETCAQTDLEFQLA